MIQWWWLLVELAVILALWFYIAWRAVGQSEEYQSYKRMTSTKPGDSDTPFRKPGDFGWPQDVPMKHDPPDAA